MQLDSEAWMSRTCPLKKNLRELSLLQRISLPILKIESFQVFENVARYDDSMR